MNLIEWMNKRIKFYEKSQNVAKRDTAVRFRNKTKNVVQELLKKLEDRESASYNYENCISCGRDFGFSEDVIPM